MSRGVEPDHRPDRVVQTDRLILHPHRLVDFDAMAAMFADPAVVRFLGGVPMSREDVWHRLLRYVGHWSIFGFGLFAVFDAAGQFLGETGLAHFGRNLGPTFDADPEAAWVFARVGHGAGYATEAVAAAHAWHRRTHAGARTVCIIDPANVASLRVAEKLGYSPFGETFYKNKALVMLERL